MLNISLLIVIPVIFVILYYPHLLLSRMLLHCRGFCIVLGGFTIEICAQRYEYYYDSFILSFFFLSFLTKKALNPSNSNTKYTTVIIRNIPQSFVHFPAETTGLLFYLI